MRPRGRKAEPLALGDLLAVVGQGPGSDVTVLRADARARVFARVRAIDSFELLLPETGSCRGQGGQTNIFGMAYLLSSSQTDALP